MAKQTATVEESNLKRQARRRLIGAVVLVLAIVVILPMIFDNEPPPAANVIELSIPNQANVLPLPPMPASAPLPEADSAVSALPASAVSSLPVSAVIATPLAVQPVQVIAETSKAKSEVKPKSEAKPKQEAKPKAAAKPKVESKASVKVPPTSGWVVQVGAYSKAETAKQLHTKLSKSGFHVYTEKAGSNMRVRVGSYPTREAAEKIKHKLEAIGLHPNVINLE